MNLLLGLGIFLWRFTATVAVIWMGIHFYRAEAAVCRIMHQPKRPFAIFAIGVGLWILGGIWL